ncbi:response regulator transcription factor [Paracoccus sp. S-4012]|uniref:helix-turn-helix transcriptional regulator n=1 Tax=Paracoccus sp. S-4012 TaxID=2665648 RepID=UPI001E6413EE|nr:response regulator transcription factor [Paracoccus sp. S-4012]
MSSKPQSGNSRRPPDLALVGSGNSFSEPLVRAMSQSLRGTAIVHLRDLAALSEFADRGRLRLLLVDEECLREAPRGPAAPPGCPPNMGLALAYHDAAYAAALYRAESAPLGVSSFLPIDVRLDLWLSIIRLLLLGGQYVPPQLAEPQPPAAESAGERYDEEEDGLGLTPRQLAVLQLVADGLPNKVIASRLGLSDHTVKLHIHNIIERLGVHNRTGAAARFHATRVS